MSDDEAGCCGCLLFVLTLAGVPLAIVYGIAWMTGLSVMMVILGVVAAVMAVLIAGAGALLALALAGFVFSQYERWKRRDAAVIHAAKEQAKLLAQIIPGPEWVDFRREIDKIAEERVPELLLDVRQLDRDITAVDRKAQEYSGRQALTDYSRELLEKSNQRKRELEAMRSQCAQEAQDVIAFLDHLPAELYVAKRRVSARVDLEERLRKFSDQITQNHARITAANAEVEGVDPRNVIRLKKDTERN